jgi:hypothetical protein
MQVNASNNSEYVVQAQSVSTHLHRLHILSMHSKFVDNDMSIVHVQLDFPVFCATIQFPYTLPYVQRVCRLLLKQK